MKYNKIDGQHFLNMVTNASIRLENEKAYVDSLNVFPVPDGDTGTNMSMTFTAAVQEIQSSKSSSIGEVSKIMAKGALMGARGNSGVILSQIFRGIAKGLEGKDEVNPYEFALSMLEGSKSAYRAVMRPTEGTILTVIREVGEKATEYHTDDMTDLMSKIVEYADDTLQRTPDLLPQLKAANVVDSGGMGLLIILKGMYEALQSGFQMAEKLEEKSFEEYVAARDTHTEITFGYCTEFIVLAAPDNGEFKEYLETMGDSIVYVGYDDITKVHIHTDNPGLVLAEAGKRGELTKIKIENMREQHRNLQETPDVHEEMKAEEVKVSEPKEKEKYAFISVSMGDGIKDVFHDLGVNFVISGGQTMNPSTQDIVKAVEEANAEYIFILPNNKNIIMAANQAKEISAKEVYVIPTKTIPQGVAALTTFNPEADAEANYDALMASLETVKSGSVTYAVRDTEIDGKEVKQGDFLGLIENKIKLVKRELYPLVEELIESMVDEDSSSITLFYGEDVKEEEFNELVELLEEKYEDLDVMSVDGKQPLYYFIIAVE
ncbi:DAK2 domain-containing protein [Proteiniclasticum sp. SCR006]|uniref:DAK2 domain-containing protein n=1 Tax=Proteiniclasticum aestuarii TaxID=2817862 RepID=A0A939H832_9CLOT|nr:DAK2 domain-containing protein [Proteiniclasticum aestuarii]MBO1263718.1 DAK2 domain-containing protein [Proteiniclasticum aestuarii]